MQNRCNLRAGEKRGGTEITTDSMLILEAFVVHEYLSSGFLVGGFGKKVRPRRCLIKHLRCVLSFPFL